MIELTPEQQAVVDWQVETGAYRDPAEVVQAGLERLRAEAAQREHDETVADVRRALADREAGRSLPVDEAFREVRSNAGLPSADESLGR